ncbi:MAG: hypothetical protein ACUVSP_09820 [Desulfotomaculales bacterium]
MRFPFPTSPQEAGKGRMIGFYSPVPGAGASSLACAAALLLGKDAALADFNPASKVRAYMGITSADYPASVLDVAGVALSGDVVRAGVSHPRGVFVVPGVVRPLDAAQLTSGLVSRAVTLLKRKFPVSVCVLDALWRTGWVAAMACDVMFVVMRPDRPDLDAHAETADLLARLGCAERVKFVLNQAGMPGGLKDDEVKAGLQLDAVIPYDPAFRAACNRRQPDAGRFRKTLVDLLKDGGA